VFRNTYVILTLKIEHSKLNTQKMNLPFKIARRYLFAKKSTNAINIISGISVLGLALGAAVLVLVLSVFNGFEKLISGMMGNFNPDVKITVTKGKTFITDTLKIKQLRALEGVAYLSETLEETAFFEYAKSQEIGILKGVDENFVKINGIDTTVREGKYQLTDGENAFAVLGGGIRNQLGVYENNMITPLSIYMPKRGEVGILEQPFKKRLAYPAGTFVIQTEFDNQYILTHIDFVRNLLGAEEEVSALEIKLKPSVSATQTLSAIQNIMGSDFTVKNRYQQDEAFLKLMNMEKWLSYAILCLTLLLVAFNMVGSLWMMVLEKKKDISILKSMGATDNLIRNVFLNEGLLLCGFGLVLGFILALIAYFLHVYTEGGLVPLPPGFATDRYPVALKGGDFVIVALTVSSIGLLASLPAALRAMKVETSMKED
jgi:lipoprotein-releasing system permease protein